ncbi:MAG: hypothetical protein ACD_46C00544G0005 [uncultured bacterium]|nr:MAG: hypothetical protein ACD_46C00544G0005 [uncultured bacterium]
MPRIKIIALDLLNDDLLSEDYLESLAESKLDHLIKKINQVMIEVAKDKNKKIDDKIFIVWREHGITNCTNRNLTIEFKKLFKKRLSDITSKYPNLAIIAGTIATVKNITLEKIPLISSLISCAYDTNQWISNVEVKDSLDEEYQPHQNQAENVIKNLGSDILDELNVIRNTCYIFYAGTCVHRHDKIAPFNEVRGFVDTVFQPTNQKGNSSVVNINDVTFGIEICRENGIGVLKYECTSQSYSSIKPLIHFVVSNTINLTEKNLFGEYIFHVDSKYQIDFFCMRDLRKSITHEVIAYKTNLSNLSDGLSKITPQFVSEKNNADENKTSHVSSNPNSVYGKTKLPKTKNDLEPNVKRRKLN